MLILGGRLRLEEASWREVLPLMLRRESIMVNKTSLRAHCCANRRAIQGVLMRPCQNRGRLYNDRSPEHDGPRNLAHHPAQVHVLVLEQLRDAEKYFRLLLLRSPTTAHSSLRPEPTCAAQGTLEHGGIALVQTWRSTRQMTEGLGEQRRCGEQVPRTLLKVSPWLRRYSSFVMTCGRRAALSFSHGHFLQAEARNLRSSKLRCFYIQQESPGLSRDTSSAEHQRSTQLHCDTTRCGRQRLAVAGKIAQGTHLLTPPGIDDAVIEHAGLLQDRALLDAVERRVLHLCVRMSGVR